MVQVRKQQRGKSHNSSSSPFSKLLLVTPIIISILLFFYVSYNDENQQDTKNNNRKISSYYKGNNNLNPKHEPVMDLSSVSLPSIPNKNIKLRMFGPVLGHQGGEEKVDEKDFDIDLLSSSSKKKSISYQQYTMPEQYLYLQKYGELCWPTNKGKRNGNKKNKKQQQVKYVSDNDSNNDDDDDDSSVNSDIIQRYNTLPTTYHKIELWKYCMLYLQHGNIYYEHSNIIFLQSLLDSLQPQENNDGNNIAIVLKEFLSLNTRTSTSKDVEADELKSLGVINSSFLKLSYTYGNDNNIAKQMIRLIMESSNEQLLSDNNLYLSSSLYKLVQFEIQQSSKSKKTGWTLWYNYCQEISTSNTILPNTSSLSSPSSESASTKFDSGIEISLDGNLILPRRQNGQQTDLDGTPTLEERLLEQIVARRKDDEEEDSTPRMGLSAVSLHDRHSNNFLPLSCPLPNGGYCCHAVSSTTTSGSDDSPPLSGVVQPILLVRHPVMEHSNSNNNKEAQNAMINSISSNNSISKKDKSDKINIMLPYLAYKKSISESSNNSKDEIINSLNIRKDELPYITIIREKILATPSTGTTSSSSITLSKEQQEEQSFHKLTTPNFFDILLQNDCLPTSKACYKCLKSTKTGTCDTCKDACPCFCSVLCKVRPPPKKISKEYHVHVPRYKKNINRLIPRIVHQTWFEPVTKDKYPNMSRLIESWKISGWEYNFYDDDTAAEFLSTHYPPEVREAYDSITPGAFKADLFRYCVLLIKGGVYADMDVLLETNLDELFDSDIGFMTPIDEPGIKVGHRSCLWNGLLAVAPGHIFLARTIEMVVNNIRNRFTSVDYDDMLCPNPALSVSHTVDTLFTCGPCILGAAINTVLGRHMQAEYEIGDIDIYKSSLRSKTSSSTINDNEGAAADDGDDERKFDNPHNINSADDDTDLRRLIPGRSVILSQNKQDMGAHRFTWIEKSLIAAVTDMPDYDDRPPSVEHYSKTHEKIGIYGLKKLYTNKVRANEEVRLIVVPP